MLEVILDDHPWESQPPSKYKQTLVITRNWTVQVILAHEPRPSLAAILPLLFNSKTKATPAQHFEDFNELLSDANSSVQVHF